MSGSLIQILETLNSIAQDNDGLNGIAEVMLFNEVTVLLGKGYDVHDVLNDVKNEYGSVKNAPRRG